MTRWRLEAAVLSDLRGLTNLEIADLLDITDDSSRNGAGDSRSVRRYVGPGRKELAALGAWPWCLTGGKPIANWWTDRRYAAALAQWHATASIDAVAEILRHVPNAGDWFRPVQPAQSAYRRAFAESDQRESTTD